MPAIRRMATGTTTPIPAFATTEILLLSLASVFVGVLVTEVAAAVVAEIEVELVDIICSG